MTYIINCYINYRRALSRVHTIHLINSYKSAQNPWFSRSVHHNMHFQKDKT